MNRQQPTSPVRIEVGTSELDGGSCRSWADPSLVLGVVALGRPEDTFARFVEPRLRDLADDSAPSGGSAPQLPAPMRALVGRLQEVHARLFRENRSLQREARWVELACAAAEEDRIWFVKTAPTWVCLLRDGQAHLAEGLPENPTRAGLGSAEKLGLEVTSIPVEPGDTIVVAVSEMPTAADLRAVARLFAQTPDLRRACDGLVNLLGLQSPAAAAVAFRFVPVGAGTEAAPLENPIEELSLLLDRPAGDAPAAVQADALPILAGAESALDQVFSPTAGSPARPATPSGEASRETTGETSPLDAQVEAWEFPWEAQEAALTQGAPPTHVRSVEPVPADSLPLLPRIPPSAVEASAPLLEPPVPMPAGAMGADLATGEPESPARESADPVARAVSFDDARWDPPARPRPAVVLVSVLLGLVVVGLLALAAIPSLRKSVVETFSSSGLGAGEGSLFVACEPPAVAVWVDGVERAAATPCRIDALEPGARSVRLELGLAGSIEGEVRVERGKETRWAPQFTGRIEVVASDPSLQGRAWVQGRAPVPTPASLPDVPLGWVRLFYEDAQVPLWDRMVFVRADRPTTVVIPSLRQENVALLEVESWHAEDGEGLLLAKGDSVFIDGAYVGETPLQRPLDLGLRSVRVQGPGGERHVELLDLRSGSARTLVASFGVGSPLALVHTAPGRVLVRGPIALTVHVEGESDQRATPTLHLPDLATGRLEVPMLPLDDDPLGFAGVIPADVLPLDRSVPYYFTVRSLAGNLIYSDLFQLEPRREWRGTAPPNPAAAPAPASDTIES